jgi:hypothetical protein
VWGLGFRNRGLGFEVRLRFKGLGFGFEVYSSGFRVQGLGVRV